MQLRGEEQRSAAARAAFIRREQPSRVEATRRDTTRSDVVQCNEEAESCVASERLKQKQRTIIAAILEGCACVFILLCAVLLCARGDIRGGMLLRSVVLLRCAHVTLPLSSISPPLCPSRTSALPETISSPLSYILVLLSSHSYPLSFLFLASPLVSAESGLCKWRPRISRAAALLAFALSNPSIFLSEKRRAALMCVRACEREIERAILCVSELFSNLLSS